MMEKKETPGFGLIVVGNEILDGRVADCHLATARSLLAARDIELRYALFLPDHADTIEFHLRWAMGRAEPFFCCGGIGSTPDDLTRDAAARATGLPLELHPEGVALLKIRFGENPSSGRLRMVDFPKGCSLVPNPVNQVPGFTLGNGHFLPGFPEMAAPMMAWALDHLHGRGRKKIRRSIVLPNAREADLVDVMEDFARRYPDVSFSSLPRFTKDGTEVELGLFGPEPAVEAERREWLAKLAERGYSVGSQT